MAAGLGSHNKAIKATAVIATALFASAALTGCSSSGSKSPTTPIPSSFTPQTAASLPSPTGFAGGTSKGECPTPTAIHGAIGGATYPNPSVQGAGTSIVCSYNGASVNLVMTFSSVTISPTSLKAVASSQAKAQSASATSVSGLGDAAYIFTLHDAATNATKVATSTLLVVSGKHYLVLVGELTPSNLEAVGRLALAKV